MPSTFLFASGKSLIAATLFVAVANALPLPGFSQEERSWESLKHAGAQAEILHNYASAQRFYGQALDAANKKYGLNSIEAEESLARLATILVVRGQIPRAEPFYRKALDLALSSKKRGKNPDELVWLDDLADAYEYKWSGAYTEWCLRNCLEIREKISDGKHTKLPDTLALMAMCYHNTGRDAQALPMQLRALKLHETRKDPRAQERIASDLIGLGSIYMAMNQVPKAEDCYKRAFPLYNKFFGEDNVKLAPMYVLIGDNYRKQKLYPNAEPYYKKGLAIFQSAPPPNNLYAPKVLHKLGDLYCLLNKNKLSEQYYKEAIDFLQKHDSPDKHDMVDSLMSLMTLYQKEHRTADVKALQPKIDAAKAVEASQPPPRRRPQRFPP